MEFGFFPLAMAGQTGAEIDDIVRHDFRNIKAPSMARTATKPITTAKAGPKLTTRQAAFAREFPIDLNAKQAAIRAGYTNRTAEQVGYRLSKNVHVMAQIERALVERAKRTEITADRVLEKIGHLAFFDIRSLLNPDGTLRSLDTLDEATAAVISGLEVTELRNEDGEPIGVVKKLKLTDRLGALTLLARHLGMLNDKLTLKGDAENPLTLLVKAIQGNTIRPVANPPTVIDAQPVASA